MLACFAFLIGSFPSGIVLGHRVLGRDIRSVGSGNFGAANVARVAGWKAGVAVALIDILKGVVPVLIGARLGLGYSALALIALAAVLGHDFSLFLRFKGGKGVATTLGVFLVLSPASTIGAMLSWAAVLGLSGYSSLASLVALAILPLIVAVAGGPPVYVVAAFILFVLGAGKHWENIIRLAYGKEKRFWTRKGS